MKLATPGYRVAVVGSSSLLGQELAAVLEERAFPVSHLTRLEAHEKDEPDLPVVDLAESFEDATAAQDIGDEEFDFVFLAVCPRADSALAKLLHPAPSDAGTSAAEAGAKVRRAVIDLTGTLPDAGRGILSVPFLEKDRPLPRGAGASESKFFVSPHPAAIVLSSLLLRLSARFGLEGAVAQVFEPASELGPGAIEELQKQTVNLLSFQKIPRKVFGDQMAFNLLPRLGRAGPKPSEREKRLRQQVRGYLAERAPLPALRLFQVPVFYSLALSLYVELCQPQPPEAIAAALGADPVRVRGPSQPAPSQVEVSGSGEILVDAVAADPDHPAGTWLWAVADNMRLAAANAVQIAERVKESVA